MMTKEDLLDNGLLVQYVLGELDSTQVAAIEQLVAQDAELQSELSSIESNFEQLGLDNAIVPPDSVKSTILERISSKESDTVIPLNTSTNKWYIGIAASVAGLCLFGSIWLYNELQSVKEDLEVVATENEILKNELETTTANFNETQQWSSAISDPNTEQYVLNGNALLPDAKLVSYVNHNTKSVIINTKQLPELGNDHDYQMWADVDGEMIDMGVIKKGQDLLAMTYIDNAESLNVTIEPAGGNDHPTVERLITNIYLE